VNIFITMNDSSLFFFTSKPIFHNIRLSCLEIDHGSSKTA